MPREAVRAAFAMQARSCARLGSPFMERLMRLGAERLAKGSVAEAVLDWPGDPGIDADNPALRLAGGLHALVLSGDDSELVAAYPPNDVSDDAMWAAVDGAMARHPNRLLAALERTPQTNEVRRASALAPAFAMAAAATGRPLALWEVGCAAGLNLRADLFRIEANGIAYGPEEGRPRLTPEWEGPAPLPHPLEVVERRGVDLAPLEPTQAEDRLRLLSYLWPDQPARRVLTEEALACAATVPARLDRADAVAWLAATLPERRRGVATVIFHSVAWQYLPETDRAKGEALIAQAGREADADSPLVRIGMEADGQRDAGLTLTLWPGGTRHAVARVDFHGRFVRWTGPVAVAGP